jgi:hypothetical protein
MNWAQTSLNNELISSLVIYGNDVIAGDYTWNSVFRSTDNGNNWTTISIGGSATNVVLCLSVSGNNIFAGTDNGGVFLSVNSGVNWVQTSLNNRGITAMTIKDNYIFAGDSFYGDVYLSSNNGTSWRTKSEGLGIHDNIWSLTTTSQSIFLGSDSGIWRRGFDEIIGIRYISSEVPSAYSLFQNYPNPFNPSTNIKFAIPISSNVKLGVYDITGKELGLLVNEQLKAGTYQTNWNALNYPSGVYFYRFSAGEYSETKRMVLVK